MFRFFRPTVTATATVTVNVNFPALDDLIVLIREQASQQAEIDELTAKIQSLTGDLEESSTDLQGSVDTTHLGDP